MELNEEEIHRLRHRMVMLAMELGDFTHPLVVALSRELDSMIVMVQLARLAS